jgi:hypothetical protein
MEVLRAETPSVRGAERLTVVGRGEQVDRMRLPQPVEVGEPLLQEAVVVMQHLRHMGHEVCSHVEVPGDPD